MTGNGERFPAAIVAGITFLAIAPAWSGPIEDNAFSAFESLCLDTLNRPDDIPKMLSVVGAKPLDENVAQPFLFPHMGKAWAVTDGTAGFVVSLTTDGVCAVISPNATGQIVRDLFERHILSRKLDTKKIGSDINDIYAATQPSRTSGDDIHALVTLSASALASVQGARLSAVPERIFVRDGLRAPSWPTRDHVPKR
jgi:hypothetical protein